MPPARERRVARARAAHSTAGEHERLYFAARGAAAFTRGMSPPPITPPPTLSSRSAAPSAFAITMPAPFS